MQITNRCYAVIGLAYSPPWYVNAGFIAGDETTLIIDTGGNAAAAATILGYARAVRPSNDIIALNTEKHFDHISGNSYLRDQGIDIYGHELLVRTPDEFRAEIDEYNDAIVNPPRRSAREAEVFFSGTNLGLPNCIVHQDTTFDLGGITAEVLFTPGHTPTNISVYADGVLFCGDCLINGYLPNLDAGGPHEWRQWLESLDKIDSYGAATVRERAAITAVLCGHGTVLRGAEIPTAITRIRTILEEAIRTGKSPTS